MNRILVAVDFSPVTDRVVQAAGRIAALAGAEVRMLHVAEPEPEFVGYEPGPQHVRDQKAREYRREKEHLDRLTSLIENEGTKADALLVQGLAVEKILEQEKAFSADLIILGSHGHTALRKALVGSVSEGVLRHATCPVLIIPSDNLRTTE